MKIESLSLKNYRAHESLSVNFQPGFNVVVGLNGSGKTSLLKAVCDALTGYTNFLSMPTNFLPLSEPDVAFLKTESINGRFRFEPQYPVEVAAVALAFGAHFEWRVTKSGQLEHVNFQGVAPGHFMQNHGTDWPNATSSNSKQVLPLVAFYRANREWNQFRPNEMQAATARASRSDAFANWADASADSPAFQGWVIAKCLERFQTSSETGRLFDEIDDDELALVSAALRTAVEGFRAMKYDLKQKSLLIDWDVAAGQQHVSVSFENLSHGQRAVIGLVADIARRMCLLNPVLGGDVTKKTAGVVLIDELDMHLHPRWQRILTTGLKRAFPSIQFIVASHSPQVVGELQPEEIILMKQGETAHPQVSYGLSSSQILEAIMGAEGRAPEVERRLNGIFDALERNELDNASRSIQALKEEAPDIPELAGAEALLRRKQVIGR